MSDPSPEMMDAAAEAILELTGAVLMAAGEVMKRHGPDPNGGIILAAGFARAINGMDRIDPTVRPIIARMIGGV